MPARSPRPGGMDRVAYALAAKVERQIRYRAEVREIRRTAAGGALAAPLAAVDFTGCRRARESRLAARNRGGGGYLEKE